MNGLIAALRPLRKPALALVAATGLVAWTGGAGAVRAVAAGGAPIVPGQAAITALTHGSAPALTSGAPATFGLLAEAGEGQRLRLTGGDAREPAATEAAHRLGGPPTHTGDDALAGYQRARTRAALQTAPSRAPPSFPS